jgi:hypothetical protein
MPLLEVTNVISAFDGHACVTRVRQRVHPMFVCGGRRSAVVWSTQRTLPVVCIRIYVTCGSLVLAAERQCSIMMMMMIIIIIIVIIIIIDSIK